MVRFTVFVVWTICYFQAVDTVRYGLEDEDDRDQVNQSNRLTNTLYTREHNRSSTFAAANASNIGVAELTVGGRIRANQSGIASRQQLNASSTVWNTALLFGKQASIDILDGTSSLLEQARTGRISVAVLMFIMAGILSGMGTVLVIMSVLGWGRNEEAAATSKGKKDSGAKKPRVVRRTATFSGVDESRSTGSKSGSRRASMQSTAAPKPAWSSSDDEKKLERIRDENEGRLHMMDCRENASATSLLNTK